MQKKYLISIFIVFLVLTFSNVAQAQWDVRLADSLYIYAPGDSFTVDIELTGTGSEIDAMGFDLHYPDSVLTYYEGTFDSTLLETWMVKNLNLLSAGKLRIAGFTISDKISPPDTGKLARINFFVKDTTVTEGTFLITQFTDDLATATTAATPDTFRVWSNTLPQIISTPDTTAWEDLLYEYQIDIVDPDLNDEINFLPAIIPHWLTFDPVTKMLSGTPLNEDVGDTTVIISAMDRFGGEVIQRFNLHVLNVNDSPQITSQPDSLARQDVAYSYQVEAVDPDVGDVLTYSLTTAPVWLGIEPATGVISGTPGASDIGDTTVVVNVSDGNGGEASQIYALHVENVNDLPVITSMPDTVAVEDSLYKYQVTATDPDEGETLVFKLTVAPHWLSIDAASGLVSGTPTNEDTGDTTVTVAVEDGAGSSTTQNYTLQVINVNDPPLAPAALLKPAWQDTAELATAQFVWRQAFDPDPGDVLTYTLEIYEDAALSQLTYSQAAIEDTSLAFSAIPNYTSLFTVDHLYHWHVKTVDAAGIESDYTAANSFQVAEGNVTDISQSRGIPVDYALEQNYPNPFNPFTNIKYQLPESGVVKLTIFNSMGQVVRTLVNGENSAGYHQVSWNGLNDAGQTVSSGLYFYKLETPQFQATQRMIFQK